MLLRADDLLYGKHGQADEFFGRGACAQRIAAADGVEHPPVRLQAEGLGRRQAGGVGKRHAERLPNRGAQLFEQGIVGSRHHGGVELKVERDSFLQMLGSGRYLASLAAAPALTEFGWGCP